ncbi:MAG: hypothetical protein ACT4O1_06525 [Gemmatimonadota bacterium]
MNAPGLWLVDLLGSDPVQITTNVAFGPRDWSADGRYVYLQRGNAHRMSAVLYRVRTTGSLPTVAEQFITTSHDDNTFCTPAGVRRPDAFVCTLFDFVSDVTLIERVSQNK